MRRWINIVETYRIDLDTEKKALQILNDKERAAFSIDSLFHQSGGAEGDDQEKEIQDWLEGLVIDAAWAVGRHVKNGRMPVYREIVAPRTWDWRTETEPHRYWAYDPEAAHAHLGEEVPSGDNIRWLVTGSVGVEEIDWPFTIARNANPVLEPEREIKLLQHANPEIISAEPRPDGFRNKYF